MNELCKYCSLEIKHEDYSINGFFHNECYIERVKHLESNPMGEDVSQNSMETIIEKIDTTNKLLKNIILEIRK